MEHDVYDLTMIHTRVLGCPTLLKRHTVVYGMVILVVVYQEVLYAATVMLISEVIARALIMEVNGPIVVYGINSPLVVCLKGLHATTPVSEIIAQALTTTGNRWTAAMMLRSVVRGR